MSLDSRAGPFLGSVQIYSFLEKYSPLALGGQGRVDLGDVQPPQQEEGKLEAAQSVQPPGKRNQGIVQFERGSMVNT